MGKSASPKRPTRRVTISNSRFQISNFKRFARLLVFLCAFCGFAGNLFAQIEEPQINRKYADLVHKQVYFIDVFQKGTVEEKRTALFEIRNLQSEIYSEFAIPALKDADEIVRATAAFSIIYLPKDEAFNTLSPNLQDKSELVRRETAYALGKIKNPNAVNLLIQIFRRDKIIEVKNACVVALGEIGDVSAIDFLTQILQQKPTDKTEFLRRSAARSLGQIAQIIQIKASYTVTPESFLPEKYKLFTLQKYRNLTAKFPRFQTSVQVITQVLQSVKESDDAKREAAFALGVIGDVSAVAILQNNLNSKDYYLAEICKESIKKLSSVNQ